MKCAHTHTQYTNTKNEKLNHWVKKKSQTRSSMKQSENFTVKVKEHSVK